MTERLCFNCRAFLMLAPPQGMCRYVPPRIFNAPLPDQEGGNLTSHFPPTHQDNVCLQHRHKGWRHALDYVGWW